MVPLRRAELDLGRLKNAVRNEWAARVSKDGKTVPIGHYATKGAAAHAAAWGKQWWNAHCCDESCDRQIGHPKKPCVAKAVKNALAVEPGVIAATSMIDYRARQNSNPWRRDH